MIVRWLVILVSLNLKNWLTDQELMAAYLENVSFGTIHSKQFLVDKAILNIFLFLLWLNAEQL